MNSSRIVVVTGAAAGIGLGISQRFASMGHPVVMLDMDEHTLNSESAKLRAKGATVLAYKVDVSNRIEIDSAYTRARKELGPISIIIANAGYSKAQDFLSMTVEAWQHTIDVNLTGTFHTIQAAVPDMVKAGWGRIVTISSNAGQIGSADRAHYAAAKGGVIGFTKALARELAKHGITVNTIPPTLVDTPLARRGVETGEIPPLEILAQHMPIARAGTPADIAGGCEFLCSDAAAYITGQEININGGAYM